MDWLVLTLVAFVCFTLVFFVQQRQFARQVVQMPYHLKPAALSPAQTTLLLQLQHEFGERMLILSHTRASQVVGIHALPRRSHWFHAINKLAPLHFDHLLCRRDDARPLCAIRLQEQPVVDDDLLLELCKTIGLPLVDLRADELEQYGYVRQRVTTALQSGAVPNEPPP